MSVLIAIGILALLVFVHEAGHFLAARVQGIYANRFSLGFGPVLWKYQGSETEYALRAIPLGGFVGFPDDDPDSTIPADDPNLLRNRPIVDRAIVISAGVIANLIFAYTVLVSQNLIVGMPNGLSPEPGVIVPQVLSADSPAAIAGLQAGDVILSADGQTFGIDAPPIGPADSDSPQAKGPEASLAPAAESNVKRLMQQIQASPDRPIRLVVQRGSETIALKVTPKPDPDGVGRIGVQLASNGRALYRHTWNPSEVFGQAAKQFEAMVAQTIGGFVTLASNFQATASQVSGPVKIVEWGATIAQSNRNSLFPFTALISINLAIINILPLPALDGGQLLFLAIEALRGGRPLPQELQDNVMQTGLVLLLGLGVFLIVRDTAQLEWVQRLLQQ